jgi:hypothetical protein
MTNVFRYPVGERSRVKVYDETEAFNEYPSTIASRVAEPNCVGRLVNRTQSNGMICTAEDFETAVAVIKSTVT